MPESESDELTAAFVVSVVESTALDREGWGYSLCQACKRRRVQLTIDRQPENRARGKYETYCWQCYWNMGRWRRGPIVNCGPLWDGVDVRRDVQKG